jgi:hypothetical protein
LEFFFKNNNIGADEMTASPTKEKTKIRSTTLVYPKVNRHPPVHHPLDACYDSVVDDPQLSYTTRFHFGNPFYKN